MNNKERTGNKCIWCECLEKTQNKVAVVIYWQ